MSSRIISVMQPSAGSHLTGALKEAIRLGVDYFIFNGSVYRVGDLKGKTVTATKIAGSSNMPDEVQATLA